MPAPSNCQFCPSFVYATINVDVLAAQVRLSKAAMMTPVDIELPAINSIARNVTRAAATTRAHSNSAGAQIDVCSAATITESFVITGEFCQAFPIFCLMHPDEISTDDGAPIERRFKIYFDMGDNQQVGGAGGDADMLAWEFDATYQYGNFEMDIAGGTGTQYNVTLSVTNMVTYPNGSTGVGLDCDTITLT